jgi:hypothetical protein
VTSLLGSSALALAVIAAARSTWSPCGISMLATITPMAEHARGHRYYPTALWFITGAVAGGVTLGLAMASLAIAVGVLGIRTVIVAVLACAASALAAASDARVCGFQLPVHHRQVNERWLDGFRAWVYGAGFGWQIGAGVATYIKTAAIYLLVVLTALSSSPTLALVLGAVFGLLRGLAVFLGRGITSPAALSAFHHRFSSWEPKVRMVVLATECGAATAFGLVLSPWAGLGVAAVVAAVVATRLRRRGALAAEVARVPSQP